jgi:hypothetical protein
MSEQDKKTAQYPVGDRLLQLTHLRSPFSTQSLRDRPSDRLRCDRPIRNTIHNEAVFGAGEV